MSAMNQPVTIRARFTRFMRGYMVFRRARAWNAQRTTGQRITQWAVLFAFTAIIIGWVTSEPLIGVGVGLGIALFGVLILEVPGFLFSTMALIVGTFITVTTSLSTTFVSRNDGALWDAFVLVAVTSLLTYTATAWMAWRSRGALWVNTLIVATLSSWSAFALILATGSLAAAVAVAIAVTVVVVVLRRPRQKVSNSELPQPLHKDAVSDSLESSGFTVAPTLDNPYIPLYAVNKTRHLVVVHSVAVDSPLTFNQRGHLQYNSKDLSGWFASLTLNAKESLPKNVPALLIVVAHGDTALDSAGVMLVNTKAKGGNRSHAALLVSGKNPGKTISDLIKTHYPPALTEKQLKAVVKKVNTGN